MDWSYTHHPPPWPHPSLYVGIGIPIWIITMRERLG